MQRQRSTRTRQRIDLPGALLIASGMFLLVFALSEGGLYGWLHPLKALEIGSWNAWPASRVVSVIPIMALLALLLLGGFIALEAYKERVARDPLFQLSQLRYLGFRYGLLTTAVLAMGQLGFLFVLPVLLQDGQHLSAIESGLWLVPSGVFIAIGAQAGGRLTRVANTTVVVRSGLALEAVGLVFIALAVSPDVTFLGLLPGLVVFGIGLGFASSQLTNVVLSEIPKERAGAASGANTTVRQIGAALGIAVIGSLLSTEMVRNATDGIRGSSLGSGVKAQALDQLHRMGVGFTTPPGISPDDANTLRRTVESAVAAGARPALLFAATVVTAGAFLSLLIPRLAPIDEHPPSVVESFEAFEPMDVDRALVD
jgi:hypothetical protein